MDYEYLVNATKSFNVKNLLLEILNSSYIWEVINDLIINVPENLPKDFDLECLDNTEGLTNYIIEILEDAVNKYDK